MFIEFCKSKIAHGHVTEAQLHYEGSITVDQNLLKAVDIIEGEKVHVLNMNNAERFETYAIAGPAGSGVICLNGPAARLGVVGDQIVILSYAMIDPAEAKKIRTKVVYLGQKNQIKK